MQFTKTALPIVLVVVAASLSLGSSCNPIIYNEGEPNQNPVEADANNTWYFTQPKSIQARGSLTVGSDEKDVWILRTVAADNDVSVTLFANPSWPNEPDEACLFVEVTKCTQAGVADWNSCPSNKRVDEFTIWNCEPFGQPASPVGNFTIGQDKLFKLKIEPDPTLAPGTFADTSYGVVLRHNP